jgi:hypothetical protein
MYMAIASHPCISNAKHVSLYILAATGLARWLRLCGSGREGGEEKVDNIKFNGGTSKNYILARLHRDRPDLAARVKAKEMSANAAAIEAGFRRKAVDRHERPE